MSIAWAYPTANDSCLKLFDASTEVNRYFAWENLPNVSFTADELLSSSELRKLSQFGTVNVTIRNSILQHPTLEPYPAKEVVISVGEHSIFSFKVAREKSNAEVWVVEELESCPLGWCSEEEDKRSEIQLGKGLSAGIFLGLVRYLMIWARDHGAKAIRTYGANNFLVSQLYQRQLGFRPYHPGGIEYFSALKELFTLFNEIDSSRREFTPTLFSYMLGLWPSCDDEEQSEIDKAWSKFERGPSNDGANVISTASGHSFFIAILSNNLVTATWIKSEEDAPRLMRWGDMLEAGYLVLNLQLK